MKHLSVILYVIFYFLCIPPAVTQEITVSGTVVDATNQHPIPGVNIYTQKQGTTTDEQGNFTLTVDTGASLTIAHIRYETQKIVVQTSPLQIQLTPVVLQGEPVFVRATRAVVGETPVAFSNVNMEEINTRYTVEDVPMILAYEPGVYAYSESGNGTGYSYVSIRGFDQSRIAVLLDNVPLNDNESHQVYWVDHGDILNDAREVQIQRGVGNSLYGSSAFGGSINVITQILSERPLLSATAGYGSYNTSKLRIKYQSGPLGGNRWALSSRLSMIDSDGYRQFHNSRQRSLTLGVETRQGFWTHRLRGLLGYENTHLAWDGVSAEDINNRQKRRSSYRAYTDDFLQQVYSLNSHYQSNPAFTFENVLYLVKGAGYYRVWKEDRDFYSYNLDVNDQYPDSTEQIMTTDLLRRKWIVNTYLGIIPTFTWVKPKYRWDVGLELRGYSGNHFGEVSNFSDSSLIATLGSGWYKYYQYIGQKGLVTAFIHFDYKVMEQLHAIGDLQYQAIHWTLDQDKIGHALGHQIKADWTFLNPRLGLLWTPTINTSWYVNFGKAQKEPADDEIINADDVWSTPRLVAAEVINDYEVGFNFRGDKWLMTLNAFRINYFNEQLKNIDVAQEGEYDYYSADGTVHEGLEWETALRPNSFASMGMNGSINNFRFTSGSQKDRHLPNTPDRLLNLWIRVKPARILDVALSLRYVGRQYLADDNKGTIDPYAVMDLSTSLSWKKMTLRLKINNLLDRLYATYGYDWAGYYYYWPGATRNGYIAITYTL